MTDFNSSFLAHLKKSEQERNKEFMKIRAFKNKPYTYAVEKLLRKYKRKIWRNKPHRKKVHKTVKGDVLKIKSRSRYSWPTLNDRKSGLSKSHSFDSAVLPDLGECKDFPMSEIGTRNNGNSPFNSSTSCSSPPDSQLFSKVETSGKNDKIQCQKCRLGNSEQNNNTNVRCTCVLRSVQVSCDIEMKTEGETSEDGTDSENEDVSEKNSLSKVHEAVKSRTVENNDSDKCMNSEGYTSENCSENDTAGETYIDVESLDDSSEIKSTEITNSVSNKVTEVFENGIVDEKVQYVGSNVKHSQPSTQIAQVKWQQQFMSFISSATTPSEGDNEQDSKSQSPRRKRSRKVRQSMCPCCMGSGHHRRKSEDLVRYRKPHSMMRDHRRFIRDMTQLISLRNKVMEVCRLLFPQCVHEIFNYASPDSEDVDKCIDQMISILHNAHQQFLHNLNSKSEVSRSGKSKKKFKSERKGNLKYDQINSNEYVVSICDPSKPILDPEKQGPQDSMNNPSSDDEAPPILLCSQSDQLNKSAEPELLSKLCLPGSNEGIVYAIPVENGIVYPHQTQVLLTGDISENEGYVNEDLFQNRNKNKNKDDIEKGENHERILSEADSGIVNDHDVSSPEDVGKSSILYQKKNIISKDIISKSKTSPNSAKTEQTANIFDLFSKYESTPSKAEEKSEMQYNVLNSSHEDKKSEHKTNAKSSDRNIFESLFGMNIESSVPPTHCEQKDGSFDEICDQEIQSFYFPLNNSDNFGSNSPTQEDKPKETYVEVYDPAIVLCKKPKICLRAFKEKICLLLRWLLPEITFERNFFKNTDNLEYVLDAVILSNKKDSLTL
ncbi:uncharacterized protein LOC127735155 [Mytilus californianus]|uniref:uncharacterized protein LOC127735155 n=1 Tax=Mytilus californianus TaxID=6549 RepID=UPI002247E4E0|nr:uncharacterized protein LOC127735155 [Mytilus californianus]